MKYGDTFLFFNNYNTSVFVDTNDKLEKKYSSDNYISNMCHTCTDATKIIELLSPDTKGECEKYSFDYCTNLPPY